MLLLVTPLRRCHGCVSRPAASDGAMGVRSWAAGGAPADG